MNKFFTDNKYAMSWGILGVVIVAVFASIFLITKTVNEVKKFGANDNPYYNSVSMTGKGEVVAVADIANFNFSVMETSESVESAQKMATEKINKALDYLKSKGVEEKDIKTTSYNINPKYDWIQGPCTQYRCEPGQSKLIGYDVSQNIDVKVRDTSKAGELLAGIGAVGISNVSGLQFTIDDEETLKAEARALAIADARSKVDAIAKDLGVRVVRVISFNEDEAYPMPDYGEGMGGEYNMAKSASVAPQLPSGENKITSRVYVSFEIR